MTARPEMSAAAVALPAGREIRRWTRQRSRRHSDASPAELFGDVYIALFAVAMAASMVFSLSSGLAPEHGSETPAGPAGTGNPGLDTAWLAVLPALAVTAAFVGLVARLGPLSLSAAQSSWWLPLAVERRTLLRPAALRWPAFGAVLGAVEAVAIALSFGARPDLVVASGLLGAAAVVTLVVLTGLAQPRPDLHRAARRTADVLLAAVPVAGLVLALTGAPPPTAHGGGVLAAAGIVSVAALALVVRWDTRLADVPAVSLRTRGAASDEALVAVLSLDPRALGRALAARSEPSRRRRSTTMPWLSRVPVHLRPEAALVTSDLLLFVRSPRHVVQVVISACLPAIALLVPRPDTFAVGATLLIGAYVAALATADGARRAQVNPSLDAALPLAQAQVRRGRLVVPAVVMLLWAGAVSGLLGWRYGDPVGWVALGLLAAPMWAAAVVRAAYRPLPDFSGPLVDSPMGAMPPGISGVARQGPDVALVGSTPVIVALVLGTVPPVMLALQAGLTLAALAIAAHPPGRGLADALKNPRPGT